MKRILLVALVLMLCLPCAASGESVAYAGIETGFLDGDSLQLVVHSNLPSDLKAADIQVSVDGKPINVSSYNRLDETVLGTSYVFLVDCASNMKGGSISDAKEIVKLLLAQMKRADDAVIATTVESPAGKKFSGDQAALNAELDALQRGKSGVDVYGSISQCLALLGNIADAGRARCLVVLSCGVNSDDTGVTEAVLRQQVADSRIPLHVVAIVQEGKQKSAAATLCSFAETSVGGIQVTLGVDKTTVETAALAVQEYKRQTYLVSCEAPKEMSGLRTIRFSSGVQGSEVQAVTSLYFVDTRPTAAPTPTVSDDPSPAPTDSPILITDVIAEYLPFILGGLALIIIVIVVAHAMRQKKSNAKKPATRDIPTPPNPADNDEKDDIIDGSVIDIEEKDDDIDDDDDTEIVTPSTRRQQEYNVTLTIMDRAGKRYELHTCDTIAVGRDPDGNDLVLEDEKVSAMHCVISFGDTVMLQDLGSTNGTRLNGVPITRPTPVSLDDVISIGSKDIRIYWTLI